jgi:restriction system protein
MGEIGKTPITSLNPLEAGVQQDRALAINAELQDASAKSPIRAPESPLEAHSEADGERAKAAHDVEASRNRVLSAVRELVDRHIHILLGKRRMGTYQNEYGRVVDDKWHDELADFHDDVVLEHISRHGLNVHWDRWQQYLTRQLEEAVALGIPFSVTGLEDTAVQGAVCKLIDGYLSAREHETGGGTDCAVIEGCSPLEFERQCARFLEGNGWDVRMTPRTGDQGVDLVALRNDVVLVVQCKQQSSPVGNQAVQEIYTGRAFYNASVAAVVSNAGYTPSARAAAAQTGVLLLHWSELASFEPSATNPPSGSASRINTERQT